MSQTILILAFNFIYFLNLFLSIYIYICVYFGKKKHFVVFFLFLRVEFGFFLQLKFFESFYFVHLNVLNYFNVCEKEIFFYY
jgi:hypothetical protein